MWCSSVHKQKDKTINANANLKDASDAIVSALAGFSFETVQEGELVSA